MNNKVKWLGIEYKEYKILIDVEDYYIEIYSNGEWYDCDVEGIATWISEDNMIEFNFKNYQTTIYVNVENLWVILGGNKSSFTRYTKVAMADENGCVFDNNNNLILSNSNLNNNKEFNRR